MFTFSLRRAALTALAAVSIVLSTGPAYASAPPAGTAAPAFQRMQLGDFEVTAISDGTLALDLKTILKNVSPARLDAALGVAYLREPVTTSCNAYLVNTGAKLVLIDTGAGGLFGPTLGSLVNNLKAAGYRPEQIDEIYITHFHGDHIGGLTTSDGAAVFPNAIVRADQREADFWLSDANKNAAPAANRSSFDLARKTLAPYIAAGHFTPFKEAMTLVPGIRAVSTHGHTPGHTSYLIESRGHQLIVWGDIVHAAAVQFADPNIAIEFDSDSRAAIATRRRLIVDAAEHHLWVADAHISFPGLGHVVRNGGGYQWLPANYEPVIQDK